MFWRFGCFCGEGKSFSFSRNLYPMLWKECSTIFTGVATVQEEGEKPNGGHQHTGSCAAFSCSPFLSSVLGVCICSRFSQRGHFEFFVRVKRFGTRIFRARAGRWGKQLFGLSSNFFLSSSRGPSGFPKSWCIYLLCPHAALKKRKRRGVVWCCPLWVANHPAPK